MVASIVSNRILLSYKDSLRTNLIKLTNCDASVVRSTWSGSTTGLSKGEGRSTTSAATERRTGHTTNETHGGGGIDSA